MEVLGVKKMHFGREPSGHSEDIESLDIAEVPSIVGDQRQAVGSGRRCDPGIVHGNGPRATLAANGSPFLADFDTERDHDVGPDRLLQLRQLLRSSSATVRALIQFADSHEGDSQGVSREVRSVDPRQPMPPHQVRDDVGVEHECAHYSPPPRRRWSSRRS